MEILRFLLLLAACCIAQLQALTYPFQNPELPIELRVNVIPIDIINIK